MKKFNQILISLSMLLSISAFALQTLPPPAESKVEAASSKPASEKTNSAIPAPVDEAKPLDGIVAIVNDGVITQSELNLAVIREKQQLQLNKVPNIPPNDQLKKMVLEKLIYQRLQLEIAKRAGITVTDLETEQALNNIAQTNHLTLDELKQRVLTTGLSFKEYKKDIQQQLLINKVRMQAIGNKVDVTDNDVKNYLEQYQSANKAGTQYHLYDLLIPIPDTPTADDWQQAKQKADAVIQLLQQDPNIVKIAKNYQGTDLGWRPPSDLPNIFAEQLQKMRQGEIAGPLKADNGYHIIKLLGIRQSKVKMPSKQEVLVILRNQQFQKAVIAWLKELRQSAYVKIIDQE